MLYRDYDIVVVGAGHAGCEAAYIASQRGYKTILISQNLDCVAKMSCNPSIGGIGKGHLVRELDALGGIMGKVIDQTMIQFKMLNTKKGPAVQAMRAQADKLDYHVIMKKTLEQQKTLDLFMDTVTDLIVENGKVVGVITERGNRISAKAVVLTTGTFMEGKIHIGEYNGMHGRLGELSVLGLSANLKRLGFNIGRLKTGTPARVAKRSIDFSQLEIYPGDPMDYRFSNYCEAPINRPDIPCYVTYTNEKTHEILRNNFHRSPLFSGKIKGIGPRYCPSLEDKVKKFPERDRHQIYIEPEGLYTDELYLNGCSSSMPEDVQYEFLTSIKGFENIEIMRPAYAVEYDYLNPIQLKPSMETKLIAGLFIAGQTNGTSGYEEAAAQGCMAGINACLYVEETPALILSRDEAYLGVMIDDLVTHGAEEPYRMFTSRAEYRLQLRQDNADTRLSKYAIQHGFVSEQDRLFYEKKHQEVELIRENIINTKLEESDLQKINIDTVKKGSHWEQYIKHPQTDLVKAYEVYSDHYSQTSKAAFQTAAVEIKYEGYINRQERAIEKTRKQASRQIPADIDYSKISGLPKESKERLEAVRPENIGQLSRIPGIRPSDVSIVSIYVYTMTKNKEENKESEN